MSVTVFTSLAIWVDRISHMTSYFTITFHFHNVVSAVCVVGPTDAK